MKKKTIICILIIILIILIGVFYILKDKEEVETQNPTSVMNNVIVDSLEKAMENKLDEVETQASADGNQFYGEFTENEWLDRIKKYYRTYMDFDPVDYKMYYDKEGRLCIKAIYDDKKPKGEKENTFTIVEEKMGIAEDSYGNVILLLGDEILVGNYNVKADFTDNQVLGIAYVNSTNYSKTLEKYCEFPENYRFLDLYDISETEYGNEFLFIPKDDSVHTSIYTCTITDDGELEKGEVLVSDKTKSFIFKCDFVGDLPAYVVEMKCNGYETVFPLVFSGKDGTLDLTGNEAEIKDLTIY